MLLYAIILEEPSEEAWSKVATYWPYHFFCDERFAIVKGESTELTQEISDKVGIGVDKGISGLVIQMDYYAGAGSKSLIEWINKNT